MTDQQTRPKAISAALPTSSGLPPPFDVLPGILLAGAIGALAFAVSRAQSAFVISPIILAIVFGTTAGVILRCER